MIEQLLTDLKLFGGLEFYNNHFKSDVSREIFIKNMLENEKERRSKNALQRRLSAALFPYVREWEQINQEKNPEIPFSEIKIFSNGEFIKNKKNLCMIGAPGLGKTHTLVSIGRDLCRQGYNVKFYTACDLVNHLEEAKKNYELTKFMEKILAPHLLIIDELGFVPFSDNGARLLFDVFSKRYERGSIAVSSNLAFNKWAEIFGGLELTKALLDRFTHNCDIFTYKGESIRFKQSIEKNLTK
jgi:DNA replication protein DnaC